MKVIKWGLFLLIGVPLFFGFVGKMTNTTNTPLAPITTEATPKRCGPLDIGVDKLRAKLERFGYVRITGILTNTCSEAVGPQVKITSYNKAGDVLFVKDIWPASTNNIPANSNFPFEWLDEVNGFDHFTFTVMRLDRWPER